MYTGYSCNLISLSLMLTLAVCDLSVTAVSKVVRVTQKDLPFSTTRSSRMDMVTTWFGIEITPKYHFVRRFTHGMYCQLPLTSVLSSIISIYFSYITLIMRLSPFMTAMLWLPPLSSTNTQLPHECCMSSEYSLYACITITLVYRPSKKRNKIWKVGDGPRPK